jgi:ribosomal protein S6
MAKKREEIVEDEIDALGSEPRVYELGFHLDPELPTEEVKKAYQAVRSTVSEHGTVVAEGEPEKIQLAYTISRQEVSGRRDFDSAYFSWIAYEATPENHSAVIATAGANARIIRFIDLLTTKEAARHAVEMHEIARSMASSSTPEETEEQAPVAELDAALENVVV